MPLKALGNPAGLQHPRSLAGVNDFVEGCISSQARDALIRSGQLVATVAG